MSGQLRDAAAFLSFHYGDLLRGPDTAARPDMDRALDEARARLRGGPPIEPGQLTLDVRAAAQR